MNDKTALVVDAAHCGGKVVPLSLFSKLPDIIGDTLGFKRQQPAPFPGNRKDCADEAMAFIVSGPDCGFADAIGVGKSQEGNEVEMSLAANLVGQRYQVLAQIGSGGAGQVFLVMDLERRRQLAVKFFRNSEGVKELYGLGQRLSLNHTGLVEIVGHGKSEDGRFIWYFMPPADDLNGGPLIFDGTYIPCTLAEYLKSRKRLPLPECVAIACELCSALIYLHAEGFIHRDIKPANILRVDSSWKLADIGLLARIGSESIVGTLQYMPPEGHGQPAGDIYSIGIVLKQMLAGNPQPANAAIATSANCEWAAKLQRIVGKATCSQAGGRYHSAEDLLWDLEKVRRVLTAG
jgi:serine/threonine protein kinase